MSALDIALETAARRVDELAAEADRGAARLLEAQAHLAQLRRQRTDIAEWAPLDEAMQDAPGSDESCALMGGKR